jgi:hypothetical protein
MVISRLCGHFPLFGISVFSSMLEFFVAHHLRIDCSTASNSELDRHGYLYFVPGAGHHLRPLRFQSVFVWLGSWRLGAVSSYLVSTQQPVGYTRYMLKQGTLTGFDLTTQSSNLLAGTSRIENPPQSEEPDHHIPCLTYLCRYLLSVLFLLFVERAKPENAVVTSPQRGWLSMYYRIGSKFNSYENTYVVVRVTNIFERVKYWNMYILPDWQLNASCEMFFQTKKIKTYFQLCAQKYLLRFYNCLVVNSTTKLQV